MSCFVFGLAVFFKDEDLLGERVVDIRLCKKGILVFAVLFVKIEESQTLRE